MKKYVSWLLIAVISVMFCGCATIVGGAYYNAKVVVPNHPHASIYYDGQLQGIGEADIMIKRRDANKVAISVQDKGCDPVPYKFKERVFRGWSFVGTYFFMTPPIPMVNYGICLPVGIIVDAITGAWWKPDVREEGVIKKDNDHFIYNIYYDPAKIDDAQPED